MRTYWLSGNITLVLDKIEIFHNFMLYDLCNFILNLFYFQRLIKSQRRFREKRVFVSVVLDITIIVKSLNTLINLILDFVFWIAMNDSSIKLKFESSKLWKSVFVRELVLLLQSFHVCKSNINIRKSY